MTYRVAGSSSSSGSSRGTAAVSTVERLRAEQLCQEEADSERMIAAIQQQVRNIGRK